jgi:2-polyprenyl-6-methoxyphenol hydroxylase-like FAD-dependent oxidoreductase
MAPREVDVLVVGAGPAGLTAAAALRRYGVEVLVLERKTRLSWHPRATVVSTRSMELLRSWGLEDEIRGGGIGDVEWLGLVTTTLAGAGRGKPVTLGLPTKEQAAVLSPVAPLCAPQDHTEAVLLGYARSLGAEVAFGRELVRVDVSDEGTEALVRHGDHIRGVSARYVIGADGAHSVVRRALGIDMGGPGAAHRLSVTAAFTAPLWDVVGEPRYGLYPIVHPEVPSVFVPSGRGDEWVFGVDADLMERPDEAEMTRLIRIAAGVPDLAPRIHRVTTFSFAAEIADCFAERSAFLIGDAAHRVTPRGGTGMNTAIADGHDLGWKLGWVLKGWADESLLDTYEAERRPVAWHNLQRSVDERGSYRDPIDELHVDLGGRIAHLWVETEDGRMSTLDLVGDALTLFTGADTEPPAEASASADGSAPVTVCRLPAVTARALGIPPGGSLLVRPSGVPARPAESRSMRRGCAVDREKRSLVPQ